jgi:predicted RNase H-like HicB family nuclease
MTQASTKTKLAKPMLESVVFERSGKWWAAELPSFPGAYGQGKTQVEAYRNLLSAVRDLVDAYADQAPKRMRAAGRR